MIGRGYRATPPISVASASMTVDWPSHSSLGHSLTTWAFLLKRVRLEILRLRISSFAVSSRLSHKFWSSTCKISLMQEAY